MYEVNRDDWLGGRGEQTAIQKPGGVEADKTIDAHQPDYLQGVGE